LSKTKDSASSPPEPSHLVETKFAKGKKVKSMKLGDSSEVRQMTNGDWCIPFSVGFQFEKFHSFIPEETSITVSFKMRLAFKFTGLPDIQKVMDFI